MEKQFLVRSVRFPIKLKLILLLVTLLALSTSLYLWFAIDLFTKDKSAYLYENNLSHSESFALRATQEIKYSKEQLSSLYEAYRRGGTELLPPLFNSASRLAEFSIYEDREEGPAQILGLLDEQINEEESLPDNFFIERVKSNPLQFDLIKKNGDYIYRESGDEAFPHLVIAKYVASDKKFLIGRLSLLALLDMIKGNKIYSTALYQINGGQLIRFQEGDKSIDFSSLLTQKSGSGVREIKSGDGEPYLVSYKIIQDLGLAVFSMISKKSAFSVTEFLVKQSLFVAVFILSIAIVIGILFSKGLTSSIERLSELVTFVSKGDFSKRVKISSNDEIGALSDSFNNMSDQIVDYMDKMKEKIRMENEIAVAQLVQASFFPKNEIKDHAVEIAAFYRPATECGGDWWGHFHFKDKTIFIIADATGHGVPAALLTATAFCSANNLKILMKSDESLAESPARILSFFNQAVASVGDRILMTAFVGIIDHSKNLLTYSNASHNPPLLLAKTPTEVSKDSFKSLTDAVGPHLGKSLEGVYEEISVPIFPNDEIILYTDGLIEATNKEGKQWGPRRFLKGLVESYHESVNLYRDQLIKEAFDFQEGVEPPDDITVAIIKVESASVV